MKHRMETARPDLGEHTEPSGGEPGPVGNARRMTHNPATRNRGQLCQRRSYLVACDGNCDGNIGSRQRLEAAINSQLLSHNVT